MTQSLFQPLPRRHRHLLQHLHLIPSVATLTPSLSLPPPGGTVTSSTTSSAPAGGYSDDTFRRMVGEDNVDKISNLVYKVS